MHNLLFQFQTRYHLGTLAFAALVLRTCTTISFIMRGMLGSVNYTAITMCATHGTDFVRSSKDGFRLVKRNVFNMAEVNRVSNTYIS